MLEKRKRYDNLDGLRTYAAIGIVLLHVLTNGNYMLQGYLFAKIILLFRDFVYLFMAISGFSICCGYLDKMKKQQMSLEKFYKKRYIRILPFFAVLILMDIIISPSVNSLYEAFSSLTLCFGLLPNANHTVIGVSWTLGVIFVFYLIFPFLSVLLANKKRAWVTWIVCLFYNYACINYYFDINHVIEGYEVRQNFLFCAVHFVSGAMIYLYKDRIEQSNSLGWFIDSCLMAVAYYLIGTTIINICLNVALLSYAISKKNRSVILNNKWTKFISGISMEIYLSHMVIYRLFEKIGVIHIFGRTVYSYILTVILTIVGTILFILIVRWMLEEVIKLKKSFNDRRVLKKI